MIFTASDIESLSGSLSRWEWAEYVSEAFVIIACAGEFVADLERPWLTEERKHHLQRRSTILLVAALFASLVCLIRTNELSGSVIGFLGQRAEEAGAKAKEAITDSSTALSQAKDALAKAGTAESSLGKAEGEANKAQTAASGALTLARSARQEADSFEKDIASAKTQAAEAESHLAEAMKRANALTARLDRLTTPRRLPHTPQVVSPLQPFAGTEYMFTEVCMEWECADLLADIDDLLHMAGWKRLKSPTRSISVPTVRVRNDDALVVPTGLSVGIGISIEAPGGYELVRKLTPVQQAEHIRAAITLNAVLASNVFPPENTGRAVEVDAGNSPVVRISVGRKPVP
jgi:hypothetical protein